MTEYKPDKVTIEVVRERDSTETVGDMATAMRIIADQIEEGYTSGLLGDLAWDMEREKEDWEQTNTKPDPTDTLDEIRDIISESSIDEDVKIYRIVAALEAV